MGPLGPGLFVLAVTAAELIPLFPTQPLALTAGLLFGTWKVLLCNCAPFVLPHIDCSTADGHSKGRDACHAASSTLLRLLFCALNIYSYASDCTHQLARLTAAALTNATVFVHQGAACMLTGTSLAALIAFSIARRTGSGMDFFKGEGGGDDAAWKKVTSWLH